MTDETSLFTGDFPENYDKYLGPLLFEPYAIDMINRINTINAESVLEIACGTGRVTRHLINHFPDNVSITASDISIEMLEIAKRNVSPKNNLEFLVADAHELPFESNSFDLIICQFGAMFFQDKQKAFSEFYRVLRNGGILIFSTWDKLENNPVINTAHSIVDNFFNYDPPAFYKIPFSMHDENEHMSLMLNADFQNTEVMKVKKEFLSKSSDDVIKGFLSGNPILNEIREIDPDAPDKIKIHLEKEISLRFGSKPVVSELNAIVCKAEK